MGAVESLKAAIRDVPDFPKEGIIFKDITTLLKEPTLLRASADSLAEMGADRGAQKVVGIESRGFIFGAMVAERLGVGFVPVRKPGKLPAKTAGITYELEYGTDSLEIHEDALVPGERALVVDDLLATGGTARAAGELIEKLGGTVCGYVFLIELGFLEGRHRLPADQVHSLITY